MTSPPPVPLDPAATYKWQRPPEALGAPLTAVEDVYVIGHFGIAHVPQQGWTLQVGGMVRSPVTLTLDDVRALPTVSAEAVLECFGNPLQPRIPTRRVGSVRWRGASVAALLDRVVPDAGATHLWAEGADHGTFDGRACDEYLKDVPLDVARERGILAHAMNDEALTAEHGFPLRLFVPGYFGTNNVKWLRALTLADRRPEHLFTTELYLRETPLGTVPVRDLDVNSLITAVDGGPSGLRVTGWAWGADEVAAVEVGIGDRWYAAGVDPRPAGGYAWQRFTGVVPAGPGAVELRARASSVAGVRQPLSGDRNACHAVEVTVAGP